MNRYLSIKIFVLLFVIICSVFTFNIKALRAGSLKFQDSQLRTSKKIVREIDINLSRQYYESHKDINAIASITQLDMDDTLNFYFVYKIVCPNSSCILNITLTRYTQTMNSLFAYGFSMDWLVGRGLKVMDLNVTSYQEHLMVSHLVSYNQNNERQNLAAKLPYNNGDAMRVLLFPNGFSNLTRTGRIMYFYPMSSQYMYVVHYMQHENGHSQMDRMGWPQKKDYIKYSAIFFEASYLPKGCSTDDKFSLQKRYEKTCGGGNEIKWFYGFKSTKEKEIHGSFNELRSGYSFKSQKQSAEYGVLGFPFEITEQFIDKRDHQYSYEKEYQILMIIVFVALIALFVGAFIYWIFILISRTFHNKQFYDVGQRSDTFNSQRDSTKQPSSFKVYNVKEQTL